MLCGVERFDKLVGEFLAVGEDYLHRRVVSFYLVAYGVEQMRLAESRVAVDEQRVVGTGGVGRDSLRRSKRKKVIDMMAAVVILQNYLDSPQSKRTE